MGRDLCETKRGWAFYQTVSGHSRVSKFFKTKDEALACLENHGYPQQLIDMLRQTEHVPSMIVGSGGVFACGLELDKCVVAARMRIGGKTKRMLDMIDALTEMTPSQEEE